MRFGMTQEQFEVLAECELSAIHGFNTCAEIGTKPDMASFIANIFGMCAECENAPTMGQVSEYVRAEWPAIVAAATEGHE